MHLTCTVIKLWSSFPNFLYFKVFKSSPSIYKYFVIYGVPFCRGIFGSSLLSKSSILCTLNGRNKVLIGICKGSINLSWQEEQTYFFIFRFLKIHALCCKWKQKVQVTISSWIWLLLQMHWILLLSFRSKKHGNLWLFVASASNCGGSFTCFFIWALRFAIWLWLSKERPIIGSAKLRTS